MTTQALMHFVRIKRRRGGRIVNGPWHIMEDDTFAYCGVRAYRLMHVDALQAKHAPEGRICNDCTDNAAAVEAGQRKPHRSKGPRDMTGTARCLDCGDEAVHTHGPGTPLVIWHKDGCPNKQ